MPPVGFEPMISVLKQVKTVHALDRVATETIIKQSQINIQAWLVVAYWAFELGT
jgi:hypothetical protein